MARKKRGRPGGAKRGRGRPTKLDKEKVETLLNWLLTGAYVETAVNAAGIHKDTFYDWLKRGRAELEHIKAGGAERKREAPYVKFLGDVEETMAQAECADLQRIDVAGETIWQAAAWKLERRFPDRWAMSAKVTVKSVDEAADLLAKLTGVSKEELLGGS